MKTLSKMAVGEIDGAAQRKEWIRGGLASVARWKPVNQESISNLEICLEGGRRGTNQRTDKGGGGKGCSLYEVERGRRAATTKEGRLHSRLLLQSWFAVSLEGQKYTSSSSLREPYSNCWVHLVQGTSTGVIISIASSHAATRYIPSMSFSDLFILCIKCHWADYRHSGPVLMLISPTTDGVMPAIHHFPRILYHAAWWMQTNRSDFHSAISLLYPTSPPPPQNPHIYPSISPTSLSLL